MREHALHAAVVYVGFLIFNSNMYTVSLARRSINISVL